ncbi:DUF559 domain-containing protein [Mycobacterium noviomagense]|uniref:DUF559 domain-containing protein n=1 Tax=Mycobacterium noviomagense TaxID=459858 RepID=A0A7I7PBB1_9MYCO|nr:DUF559 domain-containing protein [Mycobacterium noviomagense]ORB17788.1 hypothetical protein BST37_03420 [Mycobacterium noviomagense]BBY05903.1 hypothetical protein MNVI_12210 [Mycobacterium noviomagense]
MGEPFIGSEALAAGALTKGQLATYHTRLFRDVYISHHSEVTAVHRATAAWLWSGRRGVVAGFSAAALHGSKWVEVTRPAELIHDNRHRLSGLAVHTTAFEPDETQTIAGVSVTIPPRTALDLACWYPTMVAVPAMDALARATDLKLADVELLMQRYKGRRGLRRARVSLDLVDAGAESPKESWLRLILIRAGLPKPKTQIRVYDELTGRVAYLDMGWEDLKVAVEYDGEHHQSDPRQYRYDAKRHEMLQRLGWIVVRVLAGDREPDIIRRLRAARARHTPLPTRQ